MAASTAAAATGFSPLESVPVGTARASSGVGDAGVGSGGEYAAGGSSATATAAHWPPVLDGAVDDALCT
mgnify:CR=1 FL=1